MIRNEPRPEPVGSARTGACPRRGRRHGEEGYSLTELTVAVLILALGILGLAGTTALVVRQSLLADVVAERSLALQTTVEGIRATPFHELGAGVATRGRFRTAWRVTGSTGESKTVEIVTVGPGDAPGASGLSREVADTFTYRILGP